MDNFGQVFTGRMDVFHPKLTPEAQSLLKELDKYFLRSIANGDYADPVKATLSIRFDHGDKNIKEKEIILIHIAKEFGLRFKREDFPSGEYCFAYEVEVSQDLNHLEEIVEILLEVKHKYNDAIMCFENNHKEHILRLAGFVL